MKRPKLGDAMFDEDDVFENIFAAINVFPKLGDATLNEDDIFSIPSFDMQIYYDDSMLLFMMIILMKVGLEECQLQEVMIPLFWRVLNLIVIIMKVDLERS